MSDSGSILRISDYIDHGHSINYFCQPNSILIGQPRSLCLNGAFKYGTPQCEMHCSPTDLSSTTFNPYCQLNARKVSCTDAVKPGTTAQINCKRWYQSENQQVTTCNARGRWDPMPQPCEPVCGQAILVTKPFIVGGVQTAVTKVPWHAGIYKRATEQSNFEYICGGSIISANVVISAMQCFWDLNDDKPYATSMFRIAVGKFYRDFNHPDEVEFQQFAIENIDYDETYRDIEGFYTADMAIVVLKSFVEYKVHIAPVCIKSFNSIGHRELATGAVGMVAGWGMSDEKGLLSDRLKIVTVDVVASQQCAQYTRTAFQLFITPDKFCARSQNRIVGVCPGDAGGGLVIAETVANKPTYYLHGIVSVGDSDRGACDPNAYTALINTAYYSELVTDSIEQRTANDTAPAVCIIVKLPANGIAFDLDNKLALNLNEGIGHGRTIGYSCKNTSHQLIGYATNLCDSGHWLDLVPRCEPVDIRVTTEPPTITTTDSGKTSKTLVQFKFQNFLRKLFI